MRSTPAERLSIAYVIGSYPLLTTTFIDREIQRVRDTGHETRVISLRRPTRALSPEQEVMSSDVEYVLPVSIGRLAGAHARLMGSHPVRYWKTLWYCLTRPHPSTRARVKTLLHFGEAGVVARMLQMRPCSLIHAHFVDRATTVALVCSRLLGIPYSATAHANDIYVDPVLLTEKVSNASFVATCTAYNARHLGSIAGSGGRVVVVHHGLDVDRFQPDRRREVSPPSILSVAQLKEKKGLRHLIDACHVLATRGQEVRCVIVGSGPLEVDLRRQIELLGLERAVTLAGALPQEEVIEWMAKASVFALPAVVAADGDRDGIPNVILEAMAMAMPVVATRHSGIPEAVSDGVSGILVEPGDVEGLAEGLALLLGDPRLRRELGESGRLIVEHRFRADRNVDALVEEMELAIS